MKKKIVLLFNDLEEVHLGKDVFLVPYYIGKKFNCSVEIAYPPSSTNGSLPDEHRGCKLTRLGRNLNGKYDLRAFSLYVIRNAIKIDLLIVFHGNSQEVTLINLYKFCNPHGKVYVKMDCNPKLVDAHYKKSRWVRADTTYRHKYGDKLGLLPNGFDEELLRELDISAKSYKEKENIILSVGRIGPPPKNSIMLLKALAELDLKNWKCVCIGPIEKTFKKEINGFFEKHPKKKAQVFFIGNIANKRELWDWYNRSKVFVLTSKWESYALVLVEALRFGDYLLSTDVGAYSDLNFTGSIGRVVRQDDDADLCKKMQELVDGTVNADISNKYNASSLSWEYVIDNYFKINV